MESSKPPKHGQSVDIGDAVGRSRHQPLATRGEQPHPHNPFNTTIPSMWLKQGRPYAPNVGVGCQCWTITLASTSHGHAQEQRLQHCIVPCADPQICQMHTNICQLKDTTSFELCNGNTCGA